MYLIMRELYFVNVAILTTFCVRNDNISHCSKYKYGNLQHGIFLFYCINLYTFASGIGRNQFRCEQMLLFSFPKSTKFQIHRERADGSRRQVCAMCLVLLDRFW